jgi:hypothetical protein
VYGKIASGARWFIRFGHESGEWVIVELGRVYD